MELIYINFKKKTFYIDFGILLERQFFLFLSLKIINSANFAFENKEFLMKKISTVSEVL